MDKDLLSYYSFFGKHHIALLIFSSSSEICDSHISEEKNNCAMWYIMWAKEAPIMNYSYKFCLI